MSILKRIAAILPEHRANDLRGLKQDIEDEISDHLECAQDRELQRGADEALAFRKVLELFGDPKRLANKLWRDAMMDRMLKRWVPFSIVALAVLCACVLPPFQRARTSAMVQKANGEMRSLATAIFDYDTALLQSDLAIAGDPPAFQKRERPSELANESAFRFGRIEEIWPYLTSPIQAISSIPKDPFDPEGGSYLGAEIGARGWFLVIGLGPDGELDLKPQILEKAMRDEFLGGGARMNVGSLLGCPGCGTFVEALRVGPFTYSPTNGTYSNGDLIRFSQ